MTNTPKKRKNLILYGMHAVNEALKNPRRKSLMLFLTKKTAHLAKGKNIPPSKIKYCEKDFFKTFLPEGSLHQEVALECEPLNWPKLDQFLTQAQKKDTDLILALDQIQDPHNLGAVLRSAVAFGASSILLPEKNSTPLSGLVGKIASGALEHIPLYYVTNLASSLKKCQKAGYWTIGLDERGENTIDQVNFQGKNILILGAEGKGLRELTRKNADLLCRLPTSHLQPSLNLSNAAAIALYEANRQKAS